MTSTIIIITVFLLIEQNIISTEAANGQQFHSIAEKGEESKEEAGIGLSKQSQTHAAVYSKWQWSCT